MAGEVAGGGKSLLVALMERLQRMTAIEERDLRTLDRQLDKVERAFGWGLIDLRQWMRDVTQWNSMAATMGRSILDAAADGSLTLGQLRDQVGVIFRKKKLTEAMTRK